MPKAQRLRVVELFAGVGGFRLGLESEAGGGWEVVWANQWEPPGTDAKQFAFKCYVDRFDPANLHPEQHVNEDLAKVLDEVQAKQRTIPDHDLLVGGFPCQDYSVAKPLPQARGLHGKKGVLWWEIHRLLTLKRRKPRFLLLENVDRMLKSPASQRGRDFAIILSCLAQLGYFVEWRVVNAADYGFPQRRRRVFIYAERPERGTEWDPIERLLETGVLARALPVAEAKAFEIDHSVFRASFIEVPRDPYTVSTTFGTITKTSPFLSAGIMCNGKVWTHKVTPRHDGEASLLRDVLVPDADVSPSFYVPAEQVERWAYLKGPKQEQRTHSSGFTYKYSEGGMAFPDAPDRPSRTILTGEGGTSASRFKHIIQTADGRFRRLTPEELERLNGFPSGWTDTGMSDVKRAFCMGNALVVGVVERIGREIRREALGD